MTIGMAIGTMIGGFLFPFTIQMIWGKMVDKWGPIGGWIAAAFIVGLIWAINHGIDTPLMYQSGAWVDQGWAAGIGVFTSSVIMGGSAPKATINITAAVVGGILGGYLLSLIL